MINQEKLQRTKELRKELSILEHENEVEKAKEFLKTNKEYVGKCFEQKKEYSTIYVYVKKFTTKERYCPLIVDFIELESYGKNKPTFVTIEFNRKWYFTKSDNIKEIPFNKHDRIIKQIFRNLWKFSKTKRKLSV